MKIILRRSFFVKCWLHKIFLLGWTPALLRSSRSVIVSRYSRFLSSGEFPIDKSKNQSYNTDMEQKLIESLAENLSAYNAECVNDGDGHYTLFLNGVPVIGYSESKSSWRCYNANGVSVGRYSCSDALTHLASHL